MKRITPFIMATVLGLILATTSGYPQGTLSFNNVTVSYAPGGPATPGPIDGGGHLVVDSLDFGGVNARAGLYYGPQGTPAEALVLHVPPAGFGLGASAGHPLLVNINLDGVAPGAPATVEIRVWDTGTATATYADAAALSSSRGVYLGTSGLFNIVLGNPSEPPPPVLTIPDFSITYVPEPSSIGLVVLSGLTGLFLLRRGTLKRH